MYAEAYVHVIFSCILNEKTSLNVITSVVVQFKFTIVMISAGNVHSYRCIFSEPTEDSFTLSSVTFKAFDTHKLK